jgi:hypothetical protein
MNTDHDHQNAQRQESPPHTINQQPIKFSSFYKWHKYGVLAVVTYLAQATAKEAK